MLREAWKSVKANGGAPGVDKITIEDLENWASHTIEEIAQENIRPPEDGVCKMILEPIFEADFEESSYGFRPGRSSKDAIGKIKEQLKAGKTEVYDADLSSYFDTIPHEKLQVALEERIADPRMLKLLKKWLKAPVKENGQYKGGKGNKTGTPQGGVISPLLANIYLHLLDRIINNPRSIFGKDGNKYNTICG